MRAHDVQENVDENLLKEEDCVAVSLSNYKKKLVIDKIIELKDISFIICYWKGSSNKV